MRKRGCSLREIAKTIGCSRSTLRKYGPPKLGSLLRRFKREELDRIAALRKRGLTVQEIAIAGGHSQSAVVYQVRRLGVAPEEPKPRRRSEITDDLRKRVVALHKKGHNLSRISNLTALARTTVRSIVLAGGRPPSSNRSRFRARTTKEEELRIVELRRAGSSLQRIADEVGLSNSGVLIALRRNGFPPGRITLLRLAGPLGRRVKGLCKVKGCRVRQFGAGLCTRHEAARRQGRIDKDGRSLPSRCEDCNKKIPWKRREQLCENCKRARAKILAKINRDYNKGRIDEKGRPTPSICEECGKKFHRLRKARFCESCAVARQKMQNTVNARKYRAQRAKQRLSDRKKR